MNHRVSTVLSISLLFASVAGAGQSRVVLPGSKSPLLRLATDAGHASPVDTHEIVVSLNLRNRDALNALLMDIQDPSSPNYGKFLTQDEFNAAFAPTADDEAALAKFLSDKGLTVTDRFPNRLLIGAVGNVRAIENALGVEIHKVHFKGQPHYATLNDPSLPSDIAGAVAGVIGLDDLAAMNAHVRPGEPQPEPAAQKGRYCCHLSPIDVSTFYNDSGTYNGAGQTIVIAGAYAWKGSDNTTFNDTWGLPQLPSGSGQVCTGPTGSQGCKFNAQNSIEVALDVEYAHGIAPGAKVLNYMAASTSFSNFAKMYNAIVTQNPGHVVTTSWGACEAGVPSSTQTTNDSIFANGNVIGQSWFAASGDGGSEDCSGITTVDHPANSPHVMGVGGTEPTCSGGMNASSPACGGYGSETAWSGSGGGISQLFPRPSFQLLSGCGVPTGSQRLVPDIALEAATSPGNYVIESGLWYIVGGTSGAAPQWAGILSSLNQKKSSSGSGNPGALLYGLCGSTSFHDVTSGSNGAYDAVEGYDMVTGIGTPNVDNLLGP
jgi:subtilase family serine protease